MNLSAPFVRRPVATTLLTIGATLVGIVAFQFLPVASLPQVEFPTINVSASLPGASPETMASSVAAPLERQFTRIAGVTEMTSSSTIGGTNVTLQFELSRDIDGAARDVQAAINAARADLPSNLPTVPRYSKVNPADGPILILALTSELVSRGQMYDAASSILQQKLSQVEGVGQVAVGGGSLPAIRVDLNPTALNKYGIGLGDVRQVLTSTNVNRPKGQLTGDERTWEIRTNDQLRQAEEYLPLIVAYRNGRAVQLSDVASVETSVEDLRTMGVANGTPAVLVIIYRQAGANIIETVDRLRARLPQLEASLPGSMSLSIVMDRTPVIRASLHDVERTLAISVGLVILVVFVFLRNLRATLIPAVAVPVSLISTFGVMYLAGFSINNLTLMALTISTGFVVDDAIVMIENIARYIERGASPFQAALKGSKQIAFTILSLTVSLIAVLIPLLFMGDVVGRLFREFAVTLSITILISAVVSLTLTPMMCARLLRERREEQPGPLSRASQRMLDRIIAGYGRSLQWVLQRQQATLVVTAATLVVTVALFVLIPKGAFYRSPVVLRAAAGLAILIMLTVVSKWLLNDEPIEPLVFKSKAKTEQTTLPDGSKVFMNKHSEIAYSINDKGERKVSLKGEAFFEVKHDEKKPFVIQVNEVMIKDIGTAFNVKAVPENNTVEVVVESGEVQFYTPANAGLSLVKGEKAIYEKNTGRFTKVLPTPTENTVSYKSKQFEFKATLLKEVVDQLNAVYPIKIVLQDKSLESMRLSVSFNNEAPEDIIEIIADTFYLETEKTDSTVILKPKKQLN